jgi:multimeric flavodoxin WrbA
MAEMGDIQFEYLMLKNLNLKFCKGCLLCMKKGEEKCPCRDDSILLRDKMLAADGVIFISPVYVHTVSGLMKNFFDRFAYMCHQPRFRDKAAMFIVTTELTGGRETLEYMRFPAFTWGFKMGPSLDVVYKGFISGGKYRKKILNRIAQGAGDFYSALVSADREPLFRELMFFNLMKCKVTLHKDFLPADYEYWKKQGWIDLDFYSNGNVPLLKRIAAKTLVKRKTNKLIKSSGLDIEPGQKVFK